ncbi:AraC family transcriptional regulator [Tumebacillus permanentifrigoris]|uniref:AraC family transcriptional regulator n=1 Tax=Tumebacillus permanentifrigoris TaxID=378543 RepID=A0A316D6A7_9BACL|nr:AraC family transcriptional regulator [Tumebacillus permanentifrigoris]PWK06664.1 AraC family transcriptional regulator [Tumebacillus permanentifrigoris]
MDYHERIQATLAYIEENLDQQITMQELAKVACFSVFHFHRVFVLMVGDTAADYLRKRRLSKAAVALLTTNQRVLDIALEHGFQAHETFARAFKRQFQLTPVEYRKSRISLALQPIVTLSRISRLHEGGLTMTPTIVTKSAFKLIGYALETNCNEGQNHVEIPAFWQRYMNEKLGDHIPNKLRPDVELGVCANFQPETGVLTYVIGFEADSFDNVPEGMVCYTIPEATYAVFTTPPASDAEFGQTIQQAWGQAFSEWFPTSGYEHAGTSEFEWYDKRCWSESDKQMDIYIPIAKKSVPTT